ncbi:MAG: MBL fold metallo-hydrolase [Streptosporangiales bacterium]|nr:MBL fold metallo-hydrolase [Streptosporangiales bacterium]
MVEMRFLGSGDAFGSGGRFQACMHLRGSAGDLLLDCGATSLVAMKRAGVDPAEVGWVLVSRLHGDHFGGIPFLVLDGQFSRRERPLVVAGPPGIAERVREAMEVFFPGSSQVRRRFEVEFVELPAERAVSVGPATVTAFPVDHASGAPAYALRVGYGGKVLAYSGDTAWTESLVDVAEGADLFVCEAYFFAKRIPYHLDYQSLAAERHRLGCRRIVLTHMGPEMLAHIGDLGTESADLVCAADGLAVTL